MPDSRLVDGQIDARVDARPDAPPDAPHISTSPRCSTAPTLLIDTSPRTIGNIAKSHDTLYVTAYVDDVVAMTVSDPVVIPIDLTTNVASTPSALDHPAAVWPVGDDVYAAEYDPDGTIWQLHPGMPPVALVHHRASPTAVTADATYLYWAEGDAVLRMPLVGGAVEPVYTCATAARIVVNDTDLYCATLPQGNLLRGLKAGGSTPDGIGGVVGYPITSMLQDGTYIYFVDLVGNLSKLNELATTATVFSPGVFPSRYSGLAAASDFFYVTDTNHGVRRIDRTTATVETIVAGASYEQDPVLWNDQLYFEAMNQTDPFERLVMHCVD